MTLKEKKEKIVIIHLREAIVGDKEVTLCLMPASRFDQKQL